MTAQKLTPWYPGTVKPARVGPYEREFKTGSIFCCLWTGRSWRVYGSDPDDAAIQWADSPNQKLPWRGIAK